MGRRFLYAYPNKITGRLLDTIAKYDKICSYVDVPLQHASPNVLKRMKRGAGLEIFLKSIEKIRRPPSDDPIPSSFHVGFPGETSRISKSFASSSKLPSWTGWEPSPTPIRRVPAHSPSPETFTTRIEHRRNKKLMGIHKFSRKRKKALVGCEFDILLEGPSSESDLLWEGRTEMHAPEIDGKVYVTDFDQISDPQPGNFYRCQVTETHDYDSVVRLV